MHGPQNVKCQYMFSTPYKNNWNLKMLEYKKKKPDKIDKWQYFDSKY